ncbi:4-hydroxybenzoate polyprenyltransferase [Hoeflea marina]|uniref:4-hydroxybenzoate polyprenyltransferase n=2 Tax=Hoeflea marina TaxID=274592 RepID=A0A317PFC4_9HYPH|nr:4-hydroxybenzoate polyprenyltransferase [Hoeflea marina]
MLIAGEMRRRATKTLSRWLSCIRFDEVAALQATPFIGAVLAIGAFSASHVFALALLIAGNVCLVAHVFVLNDWAGTDGDLMDPDRAGRTFASRGVTTAEAGYVAAALLAASLVFFALISATALGLAIAIAGLSVAYSGPILGLKGVPLFNSGLHLLGGLTHFLLGYAAFGPIDARGVLVGCFFGLVFTAGHFTHEARDHDVDLVNGIRTNAVAFGKTRSFMAGLVLFIASYCFIAALAALGYVPLPLVLAAAFIPPHLWASRRAVRTGLTPDSLRRLQRLYRAFFAIIGIDMIVTVAFF